MSSSLIIVESPTKAKTIKKFLGANYEVISCYGHIRDLPKGELGVDVENNFEPKYVIPTKAKKTAGFLKKQVQETGSVILATDEDREGEAIAWHLTKVLNLDGQKPHQRIVFHEITKQAIEEALKNPRKLDIRLIDAQQARRILDRIVGYKLSPFLWKKIARGLSAGRVQSVAVRLVVEREREIEGFEPQEYWMIEALLKSPGDEIEFPALLIKKEGNLLDKLAIKNQLGAEQIVKDLEGARYEVESIEKKEARRNPLPPFTTSTLQQEAWRRFKWTAKLTMRIAQQLYETGNITYHRTDSLNLSSLALNVAKKFITENCGEKYYQFRKYKAKKGAQEAHEAIRPTYPEKRQVEADGKESQLYDLIWQRFVACQMSQAIFDSTTADIKAGKYVFRANGQSLKFDGFLKIYPIKYQENKLPSLKVNEILEVIKLNPSRHFTQPPARFTEASLIKALEKEGIGRPSTYAPIISTVQERNYIEKDEKRCFKPTEIGMVVNDLLVQHFPRIVDIKFTANMEENLDEIARGEKEWVKIVNEFYQSFSKNLQEKYQEVSKKQFTEKPTKKKCPKCSAPLLVRLGKYGEFYACSKFPQCRYTESLPEKNLDIECPKCHKGKIVEKRTSKGKIFYGCNRFPECDFALWDKPTGTKCPKCNALMVEKNKKEKCSNKECGDKKRP